MGCSYVRPVTIYPIERTDITKLPAGATVTIPAGTVMKNESGDVIAQWPQGETFKIEKDGRFLSNLYIREVMEAKERR
jgi:hypothetical protein